MLFLVVDDEAMVRDLLCDFLEDAGHETLRAASGEEGIEILATATPDAAVVDMRLPGMDGNDFILHAHKMQPGINFLVHTGSVGYTLPPALVNIGIRRKHVFKKPLENMNDLLQALDEDTLT